MEQKFEFKEYTSKIGLPTLNINGYFIHSKYDPLKEAKIYVDKKLKPGNVHILFGYGLGYIVDELISRFINENEKLIVIEPILKNITRSDEKVILYNGSDLNEIKDIIFSSFDINNKITLLCSPNYDKICPNLYKEFLEILKDKVRMERVNENTINHYSELWQKNYLLNLKHVVNDYSIKNLEKISSSPVVIASGGPSLSKQLPLIKKFRDNFILIASGSTFNSLLSEDIVPDFIVSIDGSNTNFEHYKDLQKSNIKLVYGMFNHYKIRDVFSNNCYYFLSDDNSIFKSHLKNVLNEEPIVMYGGGTVAHHALSIAYYLTSGPIALVGQDLAYTNNRSHAENNKRYYELTEDEIKKNGLFKVKGYYNDEVLTDYPFLAMKTFFENLIKLYNSNNIFNCTEGGAKLEGYKQITFKEFCQMFANQKINKDFLTQTNNNSSNRLENLIKLKEKMIEEIKVYEDIVDILKDNLENLSENRLGNGFEKRILTRLNKNDKKIEEYRLRTCLGVILDPINLNVIKKYSPKKNETVEEAYKRVYTQSNVLYTEYIKAVEKTKKYILELINNINNEIEGVNNGSRY